MKPISGDKLYLVVSSGGYGGVSGSLDELYQDRLVVLQECTRLNAAYQSSRYDVMTLTEFVEAKLFDVRS